MSRGGGLVLLGLLSFGVFYLPAFLKAFEELTGITLGKYIFSDNLPFSLYEKDKLAILEWAATYFWELSSATWICRACPPCFPCCGSAAHLHADGTPATP